MPFLSISGVNFHSNYSSSNYPGIIFPQIKFCHKLSFRMKFCLKLNFITNLGNIQPALHLKGIISALDKQSHSKASHQINFLHPEMTLPSCSVGYTIGLTFQLNTNPSTINSDTSLSEATATLHSAEFGRHPDNSDRRGLGDKTGMRAVSQLTRVNVFCRVRGECTFRLHIETRVVAC